jgi:predicted outer membrane lipoprotein
MYHVIAEIAFQSQPLQTATSSENPALFSWLIGLVLAVAVLVLVARPLVIVEVGHKRRVKQEWVQEQGKIQSLYERAATERKTLEELDFDQELGNLSEADYSTLKQTSENRLATIVQQIKQQEEMLVSLNPERSAQANKSTKKAASAKSGRLAAEVDGKLKPNIKEAMKCSECAAPFRPGDRFCSKCSAPLPHLCLGCGAELKQDERFCTKCGTVVTD